ncbi:MAG: hypothetical protein LBS83_00575 [Holosporales bacterium]|nr:hypothetical protein [Holosporales bacterium]
MDNFNWCFIPKPQKIADSNFLGFKGSAAIKIRILWGPQYRPYLDHFFITR